MKNLFIIFLGVMSASVFSQDIGVGNLAKNLSQDISDQIIVLKEEMKFQIENRNLDFGDYAEASSDFLEKVEKSSVNFQFGLESISDFLSLYSSIQNEKNNPAMKRLLKKKQAEFVNIKEDYLSFSADLLTLNGFLDIPVAYSYEFLTFDNGGKQGTGCIGNYKTLAGYKQKAANAGHWKSWMTQDECFGYINAYESVKSLWKKSALAIFDKCETQGCIYYLAEDYKMWFEKTHKLTRNLKVSQRGLSSLKGLDLYRRNGTVIDEMADFAASRVKTTN